MAQASDTALHLLGVWWLLSAMLVFMMQVGFLLLETGLIQERHRDGIAVKCMMMLLASTTAYAVLGHSLAWSDVPAPLNSGEWQFFQAGFAAVAATILSGSMAGRTTLVSNVIMAAIVGGLLFPLHAKWVWVSGFPFTNGLRPHDFAGSGSVHVLGGLVALAGSIVAGPRREKKDLDPNGPLHLGPRSLPLAACGVLFLWIGWMGFNGGSITTTADLNLIGLLLLTTCLAACGGGIAVCAVVGLFRMRRGDRFVYAPYATLSGIMSGMVANSASCDLIVSTDISYSVAVGAAGGLGGLCVNWLVQRLYRVDDPIEAVAVHVGGGIVGLVTAGLLQWHMMPQLVDIAVLILFVFIPSLGLFFLMDVAGIYLHYKRWIPIRLRSTAREENLGLTFDDPTTRVGLPLGRLPYLPRDLEDQINDYIKLLATPAVHTGRSLSEQAKDVLDELESTSSRIDGRLDIVKMRRLYEALQDQVDAVPRVLRRLETGAGEPVDLGNKVSEIVAGYQARYGAAVTLSLTSQGTSGQVHGDPDLTPEAVRMVLSNSVRACIQRSERRGTDSHKFEVRIEINWRTSQDGYVSMLIADNGVGIDPEIRHYLGQPFAGFNETGRGSGLGLFFAAFITQAFGGRLDCLRSRDMRQSSADDWTVFEMSFKPAGSPDVVAPVPTDRHWKR